MRLSARRLNRATLARQLLLRRERLGVVDAVHRVVAVQAQEAVSPYIALWNRIADFDPTDLDTAFADRALLKASLMRVTLHAVDPADYPAFHHALQSTLRGSCFTDPRFTQTGLTVAEADELVHQVVRFASRPRSNPEFDAMIDAQVGRELPKPGAWWALRRFSPLVHAPTGPPWSFGRRPAYLAAGTATCNSEGTESLQRLIHRYLEGFGPATVSDVARFTMIGRGRVRAAIRDMAGFLVEYDGPTDDIYYDVPDAPLPAARTGAPPRLLPMWDSLLLAYADRTRIMPPDYRTLITRSNGDVLPTLLVDGYVAGVWRPVEGGIEASAFQPLSDQAWRGLAREARMLVALLADREPIVYRRHIRWWSSLPCVDVRILPG